MPLLYLRTLTGTDRTPEANRHLAYYLAFIAGATNVVGYCALRQYTSHMSGVVSSLAGNLASADWKTACAGLGALLAFLSGGVAAFMLVNWARRRRLGSVYALPLLLEAALLLAFALLGSHLAHRTVLFAPVAVLLLCFTMGLQNAIITKISRAEIRTTHVTGMVTDLGIELGKLIYFHLGKLVHRDPSRRSETHALHADPKKLRLLTLLIGLFFLGGLAGARGFHYLGYLSTLPLAVLLLILTSVPIVDDLRLHAHRFTKTELASVK